MTIGLNRAISARKTKVYDSRIITNLEHPTLYIKAFQRATGLSPMVTPKWSSLNPDGLTRQISIVRVQVPESDGVICRF